MMIAMIFVTCFTAISYGQPMVFSPSSSIKQTKTTRGVLTVEDNLFVEPTIKPLRPDTPLVSMMTLPSDTSFLRASAPDTFDMNADTSVCLREPRREWMSVKTNLLLDLAYVPGYNRWCPIPNIAVEFYPKRGHFTFGASLDFPWWQHYNAHKFFQIRNYQLEARYYLKRSRAYDAYGINETNGGAAFRGFYLQAYAHGGLYSICFNADHGWEGEGIGGGLGAGYVLPLSKDGHWRMEFAAQFGYFVTKYDPYVFEHPVYKDFKDNLYYYDFKGDPDRFHRRDHRFTWFGPTRVGVTLSYDLLYRRKAKKGISLRSFERKEVTP